MKNNIKNFIRNVSRILPDSIFLKIQYKRLVGEKLNLHNPKTFNEKLNWLKLYDRQPMYTMMVDKYAVKQFVAGIIGEEYIIPNYGVWNRFEEIDFEHLPNQFVLKCTHDSGGLVICRNKEEFNKNAAEKKIARCLKNNFYYAGREWPYKNVKPRIIAEKYMVDSEKEELNDYKLMCFNGEHKCTFVCEERFSEEGLKLTIYDKDWNIMPVTRHCPSNPEKKDKPRNYDEMVRIAERLSQGIPFLRVDFYEVQGKLYFGELTFYPGNGFEKFYPSEWDRILGDWLVLPD